MDASVSSLYLDWTTFPCKEQPQRLIFYSGSGKSFVSLWMPLCGDTRQVFLSLGSLPSPNIFFLGCFPEGQVLFIPWIFGTLLSVSG